ncbi:MAG: hypothetical protein QM639_09595 [Rhodocyclaceae bacterium]
MVLLTLSGQASAAPPPAGTVITAVAQAQYIRHGYTQVETASSTVVVAILASVESFTLTADQNVQRPPDAIVTLAHVLTNTGNVRSDYSVQWRNQTSGDTLDLSGLRVVHDINMNGVIDLGEPILPLGAASALTLNAGQSAILLVQGRVPNVASGHARLTLTVTTSAQRVTASNQDQVTVTNAAVLSMTKSASYPAPIVPGSSRIDYTVHVTNIGAHDATPTASAAPATTNIIVDGRPTRLVMVRDAIPVGTQYIMGSLSSPTPGVLRLFRLPGDAPSSFRAGGDDASAIEVAIGIQNPGMLARNASIDMRFGVLVRTDAKADIANIAHSHYDDGMKSDGASSNTVIIPLKPARIGVAKAASALLPSSVGDAMSDVTFNIRVKNYGSTWLYDTRLKDVLEGSGPHQFGTYTPNAAPAPNQYTVVPGSLRVVKDHGWFAGTVATVNPAYNGSATGGDMLAGAGVLPVGAEFTVQFIVRFNTTGRTQTLYNSATASAALTVGGAPQVTDVSTDGTDPDPDRDGNPANNSTPTPVASALPKLSIIKAVVVRGVSSGVYDLDYVIDVANTGSVAAPNVRVIDNLNCTFDMDRPQGSIARWALQGPVHTRDGNLTPAGHFTGNAPCDRTRDASGNPFDFPTEVDLSLVDGSRALAPGQGEQIRFTVRVTEKPQTAGGRTTLANKAWVAALTQNTVNVTPAMKIAAASASVDAQLLDPQGTVYDAVTRQPIAGARVTVKRTSCSDGTSLSIRPGDLAGGAVGGYTYNADGSVSMTTAADGAWQFNPRRAARRCAYGVTVTPPAGSNYVFTSQRLPAANGTYRSCGAVVPQSTPPQEGDAALYYLQYMAGADSQGNACDVANNHIPLDPGGIAGLVLRKQGSKRTVEVGDFIDYVLLVGNKTGAIIRGVTVSDTLPPGFTYVSGSARLNGDAADDPQGGKGPGLRWDLPALSVAPDKLTEIRYRVRVGVGAPIGEDATNRATAVTADIQSNEAAYTVRVTGGVFADEAFAFGKVYMDCTRDGVQQGEREQGVPGVRLWLEDGTSVVTDSEGKWSLYGLRPQTRVLRLDETTLPPGATIALLDNRNARNPSSRFLDLKKGELHKANFPLLGCEDAGVMDEIAARRELLAKRPDAEGEAVRTRLDPQGLLPTIGDVRALPASGQINGTGGSYGAPTAPAGPLIDLGDNKQDATNSAFIDSTNGTGTLTTARQNGFSPVQAIEAGTTSLPAGGPSAGVGTIGANGVSTSGTTPVPAAQPMLPQGTDGVVPLEDLMQELDNTPAILDLKDGDIVAAQSINVRVKGPTGADLALSVNGDRIDGKRIGKKTTLGRTSTTAHEYIGIMLRPGNNELRLEVLDEFGNQRSTPVVVHVVAPDKLGVMKVIVPQNARANPAVPVPIIVRLSDAAGVPVTARTQITLEADAGRWVEEDLNPNETGLQAFIEGGQGTFQLVPPGTPSDVRVRASVANLVKEAVLPLLPDLRPMIALGIVEGTIDLSNRGRLDVGQIPAGAAFEQELNSIGSNDEARAGGRVAFFLKGAIKGEYLLTAALDTGKSSHDRLFRDIRPDEFYPIYGDSSTREFDAQSSQRLYVRIDKDRSYLLYGDFNTASSGEVRKLSQTNRTLTGLSGVYQNEDMRVTAYASNTSQRQQIEEFPANGTSGPFYLAGNRGDFVENSEQVQILVRDREQPNVILQTTPATRFVDYTIEPLSRRILFTRPIASTDANLHPQTIRVTYEIDEGGDKHIVAGADAQFKVTDSLQLGVVGHSDQNPDSRRDMAGVTALARIGESTSVAAEAVGTKSDKNGDGTAGRLEIRHQGEALGASAQVSRTSTHFDNPDAGMTAGRTEGNARLEYRFSETLAARAEALYSKDEASESPTQGASVGVLKRFNDDVTGEIGLRYGATSTSSSLFDIGGMSSYDSSFGSTQAGASISGLGSASNATDPSVEDLTTVGGRLTSNVPGIPKAQVFAEGAMALGEPNRHMAAVGANYAVTDKTRVYGRYEMDSSLYKLGPEQSRNVGMFGVESNYMEGGRVFSEYRMADALDSRAAQAAMGVRNTVTINENWSVTGGIEQTKALGNGPVDSSLGDATAIVSGVEYTRDRLKASGILEGRHGPDADTLLSSAGIGYKVNDDWSLLARGIYSSSKGNGSNTGNERTLSRQQIGIAYRPVNQDVWNALARYERKTENIRGETTTIGTISGNVFGSDGSLPGKYQADIVSMHVNVNPSAGHVIAGRFAGKISSFSNGGLKSTYDAQLLQGRWTSDINTNWDAGVQGGVMRGTGGTLQYMAGLEVGRVLTKDLWVSLGYNFIGYSDRDLTAGEYTDRGVYLRLRAKFDERTLGMSDVPGATAARDERKAAMPAKAATSGDGAVTVQADALFASDRVEFTDEGKAQLDTMIQRVLAGSGNVETVIVPVPGGVVSSDELSLAERRALALQAYLTLHGVRSDRIIHSVQSAHSAGAGTALDTSVALRLELASVPTQDAASSEQLVAEPVLGQAPSVTNESTN